jgi:hypothetical protein
MTPTRRNVVTYGVLPFGQLALCAAHTITVGERRTLTQVLHGSHLGTCDECVRLAEIAARAPDGEER